MNPGELNRRIERISTRCCIARRRPMAVKTVLENQIKKELGL